MVIGIPPIFPLRSIVPVGRAIPARRIFATKLFRSEGLISKYREPPCETCRPVEDDIQLAQGLTYLASKLPLLLKFFRYFPRRYQAEK